MLTDTDRLCHAIAEEARIQAWLYVNAQIEDTDCALMADHVIALRAAELAQQQVQGGAL